VGHATVFINAHKKAHKKGGLLQTTFFLHDF
jgi:hypothetical protein